MSERVTHVRACRLRWGLQVFEATLCNRLTVAANLAPAAEATCARCRRVIEREKEGRDGR